MEEKFKPTTEWMKANYDKLNKELFNGVLGGCILRPFTSGKGSNGRTLGWFKITGRNIKYHKSNMRLFTYDSYGYELPINHDNFVEKCMPCIELNANYSWTEHAMLATLAHEMCHYYTYMNGICPKRGHGPEFYSIGETISRRSNGMFTIQRLASAEQMNEMELDSDIKAKNDARKNKVKSNINAVIAYTTTGGIELTTTTFPKVIDEIVSCAKNKDNGNKGVRGTIERVISSNDASLIEFLYEKGYEHNMRTYRFWTITAKPWAKTLEQDYDFQELFGEGKTEPSSNVTYTTKVPQRFHAETVKPKKVFRIKLSGGGAFQTDLKDLFQIRDELRKRFPNMRDEVINKLLNNPSNYYTVNEGTRKLNDIIKEEINNFLIKEFKSEDVGDITPDMNLGLESPYEETEL